MLSVVLYQWRTKMSESHIARNDVWTNRRFRYNDQEANTDLFILIETNTCYILFPCMFFHLLKVYQLICLPLIIRYWTAMKKHQFKEIRHASDTISYLTKLKQLPCSNFLRGFVAFCSEFWYPIRWQCFSLQKFKESPRHVRYYCSKIINYLLVKLLCKSLIVVFNL